MGRDRRIPHSLDSRTGPIGAWVRVRGFSLSALFFPVDGPTPGSVGGGGESPPEEGSRVVSLVVTLRPCVSDPGRTRRTGVSRVTGTVVSRSRLKKSVESLHVSHCFPLLFESQV